MKDKNKKELLEMAGVNMDSASARIVAESDDDMESKDTFMYQDSMGNRQYITVFVKTTGSVIVSMKNQSDIPTSLSNVVPSNKVSGVDAQRKFLRDAIVKAVKTGGDVNAAIDNATDKKWKKK